MPYNTGNPVGSVDPRDLIDNAADLDRALTSTEPTFQDRLGQTRLTFAGMSSAAGDATIAIQAAERAESAAADVESNAEAIAAAAVAGVVDAVDGAVAQAESARDASLLSRGIWPTTEAGIGQGVAGTSSLVAGSGGTDGTFDLAFSGGTQVLAPNGRFVVEGGAVTQVIIDYPGYYAGTPTISFAASAGLTGASVTAVMGPNTPVGGYFSVPSATDSNLLTLYRVADGPAAVDPVDYPSNAGVPRFKGVLASSTNLNSIIAIGQHYLSGNGGYLSVPANGGFDPTKAYTLDVVQTVDGTTRWRNQELIRWDKPEDRWARRLDTQPPFAGTTAWVYLPAIRPGFVDSAAIAPGAVTNVAYSNDSITNTKLTPQFAFIGNLSTGSYNTQVREGRHLLLAALEDGPAGAPATGYLDVAVYNGGAFVVQTVTSLLSPGAWWRRVIRPANSVYYDWVDMSTESAGSPFAGQKFVFFGDSITEGGDYPERVAARLGITAVKQGYGGCRMGKHSLTSDGLIYNKMCMFNLARYINEGDYSELLTAADALFAQNGDDNRAQAAALAALDWSTVDKIVIAFGTNDFQGDVPLGVDSDLTSDGSTFKGSINYIIQQICSKYPDIQVVFVSPMWRQRQVGGDNKDSDLYPNNIGVFLSEYADAVTGLAGANHLPALDMYKKSGINKYNYAAYLVDGLHPTAGNGYQLFADRVSAFITSSL